MTVTALGPSIKIRLLGAGVWVIRIRLFFFLWLIVKPMMLFGKGIILLIQKKNHHRVETFKKNLAGWTTRANFFCAECRAISQSGSHPTEVRRQELLAIQSALLQEKEHLYAAGIALKAPQPILAATVVIHMLNAVQDRISGIQRKNSAFGRIVTQIESPTFYWDLLLWFVVSTPYSEELAGDLTEEYQLRSATDSEPLARAWYRDQVMGCVWHRIERLVAIGTLIDFVSRLFRK